MAAFAEQAAAAVLNARLFANSERRAYGLRALATTAQAINGTFDLNQRYSLDAMSGKWWSTRPAGGIDQSHPASWADVIAKNPDATISAISVDNGGSSSNTVPADQFAAGTDNVIVGFGSAFTRYDFGG